MTRHEIEFQVGDTVTYNAYGQPLTAAVKAVDVETWFAGKDERIFYHIRGPGVISTCTGQCIEESKYYVPYEEKRITGGC